MSLRSMLSILRFCMPFRPVVQVFIARTAIIFIAYGGALSAWAQNPASAPVGSAASAPAPAPASGDAALSINDWLLRMHEAAMKKRSYIGTLVQSSPQFMSSARVWHACDGAQQIERVDTLTGAPRSTFRHNDKLVTFMPETKVVRMEKREALGGFPEVLKPGSGNIPDFYAVKALGQERIAGLDSDIVQLMPKDTMRYGYRIWTEKKTSLVVKIQTLDANSAVLEQAAFSELQMDAPVKMDKLLQKMAATEGYKIDQPALTKTSAAAEGWVLKNSVPGFKPMSCYKRTNALNTAHNTAQNASTSQPSASAGSDKTMQWIFSDGLATVSLFVEEFDKTRHTQEGMLAQGATHSLIKRVNEFWLTAVGEVPPQTLKAFAQGLERKR
jgi:sigma-E factor negative regulatory protein RseB